MKLCLNCQHIFNSPDWPCPICKYTPTLKNSMVAHVNEHTDAYDGFKPEYFSELSQLEDSNFWFRARNEIILWALRKYAPGAQSFLEVGCGTGFVLSAISKCNPNIALSGSEFFLDGLNYAIARVPNANFMQMDARKIPFIDEFDALGAFDVLEHIEEDEETLTQLHQALKPNGVLFLTVPQHPWLWSATDEYACHVRRYTAKDLHHKLAVAGFRIKRSTSFVSLLLPAMLATRRKKKEQVTDNDINDEFNLSRYLNETLFRILQAERILIQCGLNIPIGGSRLIVAVKEGARQ